MNKIDAPVCVVDDDDSIRESIEGLLRVEGISVETYRSAKEFLARPSGEPPGCLILDVNLPGLSGLDLQRELTRADVYIPIIFLTGHGDIPMSVRAIKAGALEFLTKPLDPEDLLSAIQEGMLEREYPGAPGSSPHSDEIVGASSAYRTSPAVPAHAGGCPRHSPASTAPPAGSHSASTTSRGQVSARASPVVVTPVDPPGLTKTMRLIPHHLS